MQLTNQMYATLTVVGIGLLSLVWYILPAGGSYDVENETMAFPVPQTERYVVPAEVALQPLVPEAAVPAKLNPFDLKVQLFRNQAGKLAMPPAPPLDSAFPAPLPRPVEQERQ